MKVNDNKKYETAETVGVPRHDSFVRHVTLHADFIERTTDGRIVIAIPARPLSVDEEKLLARLFPNTSSLIETAMTRELLLGASEDSI